jgi:hypothetical protein
MYHWWRSRMRRCGLGKIDFMAGLFGGAVEQRRDWGYGKAAYACPVVCGSE